MGRGGKRGGARPGSGRKKGQQTLDKEQAREYVRQRVIAALEPMISAQIANATGIKYLVMRDKKTGKFVRVGAALARQAKNETIEVWEKDPAILAFTDLLNRALGKPAEHVEMAVAGDAELLAHLDRIKAQNARNALKGSSS